MYHCFAWILLYKPALILLSFFNILICLGIIFSMLVLAGCWGVSPGPILTHFAHDKYIAPFPPVPIIYLT